MSERKPRSLSEKIGKWTSKLCENFTAPTRSAKPNNAPTHAQRVVARRVLRMTKSNCRNFMPTLPCAALFARKACSQRSVRPNPFTPLRLNKMPFIGQLIRVKSRKNFCGNCNECRTGYRSLSLTLRRVAARHLFVVAASPCVFRKFIGTSKIVLIVRS